MTQPQGAVEVSLDPLAPEQLRAAVTSAGWARLSAALQAGQAELQGRTIWMVNSTAVGGGVAELLRGVLPYWMGAELDPRWAVIQARPAFFRLTKRVHNLLHGHPGDGGELGERERRLYERSPAPSAAWLTGRVRGADIVVLHDPQTAGLVPAMKATGASAVCRSHVGADHPNSLVRAAWDFLRPYTAEADAIVFTRHSSVPPRLGGAAVAVISPCIDPCATKNRPMEDATARAILASAGLSWHPRHAGTSAFRRRDGSDGRVGRLRATRRAAGPARLGVDPPSCTSLVGIG